MYLPNGHSCTSFHLPSTVPSVHLCGLNFNHLLGSNFSTLTFISQKGAGNQGYIFANRTLIHDKMTVTIKMNT